MPCTVPTWAGERAWLCDADMIDPGNTPTLNENITQAR